MVNALRQQFSLTVEKTAKTRGYMSHQLLAHTLPKGKRPKEKDLKKGSGGNEKGFNRSLLFVGFKFYVAACVSANTVSQVRQLETLRAKFE
jgi:hypothetical protein